MLRLTGIQSEAGACPIIPAAEEVPYGASASSERLFLPRVATDFYQSMTTNQVRESNFDSFHYHGRHGILGARHILLKPCKFLMSQPNSIILELGQILLSWRWCAPFLEELQIDHISLDPKKGSPLRSSLQDVRRFFFGPHHLILSPSLFRREVHRKKLQRADCIPPLPKAAMPNSGALRISF
ncbi:hypothetical protein CK203_043635 [Vitis vinifera]|uniref:Uncharacterized protein n=1 Tax=Vitis vinifera TaxID=29760 RepID=A0A438HYK1_VITVI|nr:hypothetical protein CK203_043635 [Vitis vinifera]